MPNTSTQTDMPPAEQYYPNGRRVWIRDYLLKMKQLDRVDGIDGIKDEFKIPKKPKHKSWPRYMAT